MLGISAPWKGSCGRFRRGYIRKLTSFGFVAIVLALVQIYYNGLGPGEEEGIQSSRWIVVTSIFHPTEQIQQWSQIPEWQLLVVADMKTPTNWSSPGVIFLDVSAQLSLNYEVVKLLPWNSYTRKVIGYLYAIQHGATFIYDTDDDNSPYNPNEFSHSFAFENTTRGLVLSSDNGRTANPYIHFGQPTVWPRGHTFGNIGKPYNNSYTVCTMNTPLIQQGLVNGDPDVDAIFRLTRKKLYSPLNIQFDSHAPPLIFPKSVFAPFNSQNTIFHYEAFWALLLPTTVTFRVTDIWRGYWAQPLLWRIGSHLGFYPQQIGHSVQLRNAHHYLKDFVEEDAIYKKAGNLVNFLAEWNCSDHDLYDCMLNLTTAMVENNFWTFGEIQLVKAWISDLKRIGYKPPPILSSSSSKMCLDRKPKTWAVYSPKSRNESDGYKNYRIPLREFCNLSLPSSVLNSRKVGPNVSFLSEPPSPNIFPRTLLVVTFNNPHYENIWLLDSIYRPHYPNILYCGQLDNVNVLHNLSQTAEFVKSQVSKFSFVNAMEMTVGCSNHECALRAIDMNYWNIDGYMVLSDDILFNFWNNKRFNSSAVWATSVDRTFNTDLPANSSGWLWWPSEYGLNATKGALDEIYGNATVEQSNKFVQQFRLNRENFGINRSVAFCGFSDIFYLPASKQDIFYEVGSILKKHKVFVEIAVPLLVTGISSPQDRVDLPGLVLWANRETIMDHFNISNTFLHPVKGSKLIANVHPLKTNFCDKYITQVLAFNNSHNPIVN